MTEQEPATEKNQSILGWVVETVLLVIAAFVLAMAIRTFLVDTRVIPTGSMIPTIQINDRILVDRIGYRFKDVERGDIVVFRNWQAGDPDLIKRVVALGGETIAMDSEGRFTVDGEPLDEPYLPESARSTTAGPMLPMEVPEDSVFVMGDNRNNSGDSRFNGPVRKDDILGRGFFVYWPPKNMGPLR